MLKLVLAVLCLTPLCAGALAAEREMWLDRRVEGQETARWTLVLPDLSEDVPAVSAGCVVVGHHVLTDGSIANARVMKGAFTSNVDDDMRAEFSGRVLELAKKWHFGYLGDSDKPLGGFRMVTVGFLPAGVEDERVVAGAFRQMERLRDICKIGDLKTWGEQNAIPVDQALAENSDKVLLQELNSAATYWLPKVQFTPPQYPAAAIMDGVTGCVVVGFTIKADGSVDGLKIVSSRFLGGPTRQMREVMENAAARAATQWRFVPGPDNLRRIPEFAQVPVEFTIDGLGSDGTCKAVGLTIEETVSSR